MRGKNRARPYNFNQLALTRSGRVKKTDIIEPALSLGLDGDRLQVDPQGAPATLISRLLSELRRRNVIQPVVAYTVVAWAVVQVVNELGPVFALPEWISTLVAVAGLAGFPVAVYVAWFFDFTGGAIRREQDLDGAPLRTLTPLHWVGLLVIAGGAGGAGFLVFEDVRARLAKDSEGIVQLDIADSLAVMPFRDQSPARDQAYFAEGVSEELAALLGRLDGIRVSSFNAAYRLARDGRDAVSIGRALDVAAVVSGSARVSGDQIRVRAELIASEDGRVLWSDSFSRTLNEVGDVEADIARSIANLLQDRYLEAEDVPEMAGAASSDAYVLYLRARAAIRERTAESVKEARRLFEQSMGFDPEYAAAHVGLAETLWRLAAGGENFGVLDREVAARLARQSIERALVIDSTSPEAYANLGRVDALVGDHESALTHYAKALELNPSLADVYLWQYLSQRAEQRFVAAFESLEAALSLDPTSPAVLHNLGFELSLRGDFEGAREYFDRLINLEPDNPLGYRGLAEAAFRQGQLALSLGQWKKAWDLSPDTPLYAQSYRDVLFQLQLEDAYIPLATAAGEKVSILLLQGKLERVHELMAFDVAAQPDDPWILFEAGWYLYLDGDREAAASMLVDADALFSADDRFAMPLCSPAIEVALAHRQQGSDEVAERYLAECGRRLDDARSAVYTASGLDYLAARLAALGGREEEAARHLDAAIRHGWREWWTRLDPLFADLASSPRLIALFDRIDADLARQRDEARAFLATIQ